MIAVVDYGLGNLRSVSKALLAACAPEANRGAGGDNGYSSGKPGPQNESSRVVSVLITSDPDQIQAAEKVVLPGVGAFSEGMAGLRSRGLIEPVQAAAAAGKPLLGICLGMQLLFEVSEETDRNGAGSTDAGRGLCLLPGVARRFSERDLKVPQTGWNQLELVGQATLFRGINSGSFVYFNHGYYCDPEGKTEIIAYTEYGIRYASAIQSGSLYGVQFHPEKSQIIGLKILRNFVEVG